MADFTSQVGARQTLALIRLHLKFKQQSTSTIDRSNNYLLRPLPLDSRRRILTNFATKMNLDGSAVIASQLGRINAR